MATEIGYNIPRWTTFNVKFSNMTKDGSGFSFSTVGAWVFAMSSGNVNNPPVVLKASTGTTTSGHFTVDSINKSVAVQVSPSEINYGYGQYYVALFADTSGVRISHTPKYLVITNQICPTGI